MATRSPGRGAWHIGPRAALCGALCDLGRNAHAARGRTPAPAGGVTVHGMEQPRAPLTRRLTFGQLVAIDAAAALLLAVVLMGAGETRQQVLARSAVPAGLAIALVCVACVGVGMRRWRPLTALAVAL